ncbi:hypothetical protein OQA88_12984 [Cercophora sp. LCS_1]
MAPWDTSVRLKDLASPEEIDDAEAERIMTQAQTGKISFAFPGYDDVQVSMNPDVLFLLPSTSSKIFAVMLRTFAWRNGVGRNQEDGEGARSPPNQPGLVRVPDLEGYYMSEEFARPPTGHILEVGNDWIPKTFTLQILQDCPSADDTPTSVSLLGSKLLALSCCHPSGKIHEKLIKLCFDRASTMLDSRGIDRSLLSLVDTFLSDLDKLRSFRVANATRSQVKKKRGREDADQDPNEQAAKKPATEEAQSSLWMPSTGLARADWSARQL